MAEKRFSTNGYYIYDHFKEDKWLVNEVEVEYIVTTMNNLDIKARERSKALSKLEKKNEQLKQEMQRLYNYFADWFDDRVLPSDFSEMWDFIKEDEKWD